MKLIGSKLENDYRVELVESHQYHFSADSESKLKIAVLSEFPNMTSAYVLECVPDETEELYLVLIDGIKLLKVDIELHDKKIVPIIKHIDMESYMRKLRKSKQVKLLVAQSLVNENI